MTNRRIFSGVQPTGNLHLGNYLGAIRHWVNLQHEYQCFYGIVDLHAITVPQDAAKLRHHTLETAAAYIACGVDPAKSAIYPQSWVREHTELAWILNCHTPLGWLNRMTQFKEKAGKQKDQAVLGLFAYPVLMAADILLYKSTHVPVGEDQKQHLELARDIAGAFNRYVERDLFPLPEPLIMGEATRVMSLRDGLKKMSKSDESDYSRINLTDNGETISLKFQKAKSDSSSGISYDPEARPEVANLLTIYAALSNQPLEQATKKFADSQFRDFKAALAELAVEKLAPISRRMQELMADEAYLLEIMADGAEKARVIARETIREVKDRLGFLRQ